MKKKRKGRNPSAVIRMGITPTKERCRQHGGVRTETLCRGNVRILRFRAVWECPLDAYHDLKVIDGAEYKAGLRFHKAFYDAVACKRPDFRPTSLEDAEMKPTRNERLLKKVLNILPPDDRRTIIDVCGYSRQVRDERALNLLKRGLGHLVTYWNLAANEVCKRK